jgi:hypothetical protein
LAASRTLTPDDARTLAKKTLGAVAHGNDPAALKAAERRASSLRELAGIYLTEHVDAKRKPKTAELYRSLLEKIVLPELGSRRAEQVTTSDLAKLHAKNRKHPYQANRMLGFRYKPTVARDRQTCRTRRVPHS